MRRSNVTTSPSPLGGGGGCGGASCAKTLRALANNVNMKVAIITLCLSLLIICSPLIRINRVK
jgi:hypothetical protein